MRTILMLLALTTLTISTAKADVILEEVSAAKNDALKVYRRLDRLEALLNSGGYPTPVPPPYNPPPVARVFAASEVVHFVNVGLDCHENSAKKEVNDAVARVRKSVIDQCGNEFPSHRCVTPILSLIPGQGTAAFDCNVSATLKVL